MQYQKQCKFKRLVKCQCRITVEMSDEESQNLLKTNVCQSYVISRFYFPFVPDDQYHKIEISLYFFGVGATF